MELLDAPSARTHAAFRESDGVVIVSWPHDAEPTTTWALESVPCLFLVAADSDPPKAVNELTAWLRAPAHEREIQAAIVKLRSRAGIVRPMLGDHDLVWRGTRWVALSPMEALLAAEFIARPGQVLSRVSLERTAWPAGAPHDRAIDSRIKALRRRIAPVGVRIRAVRGQGYIAQIQPVESREARHAV